MELSGTAVVTGAASGIGLALARRFASAGMNVVMADVEVGVLETARGEVASLCTSQDSVLSVPVDVSDPDAVQALERAAMDRFGPVNVLCNNAGVSGGMGPIWQASPADWTWVLGVNLLGVVNGVRAFVPGMIAHGQPGHVVNTSSVLGLSTGSASIYSVSKHAVTRLTEGLWYDLRAAGAKIGVSVLCPGMVATQIVSAERNRPDHLRGDRQPSDQMRSMREAVQARFLAEGMDPAEVAEQVASAIVANRFYVLTHPDMIKPAVEARMRSIVDDSDPPPAARLL